MIHVIRLRRRFTGAACGVAVLLAPPGVAQEKQQSEPPKQPFRGQLGPNSPKVRAEGDKTYLWAGGAPSGSKAQWYDFTGSPIDPAELQFGIGKDRIRSIDHPMFVKPDDPRLLKIPHSPYRRSERPTTQDEIMVSGFVEGGEARAYPIALLDHHELVNDRVGGKPLTVGW